MHPARRRKTSLFDNRTDPDCVELGFEVLVNLTMAGKTPRPAPHSDGAVAEDIEVCHGERMFGDPDYLLRVATPDLTAFATLCDENLAALTAVQP